MSRLIRKQNRHLRVFREQLKRIVSQSESHADIVTFDACDGVRRAHKKALEYIRLMTRPGWVVRLWRWVFAR